MSTTGWLGRALSALLAVALSSCVPAEATLEDIPRYNEKTLMGQVQARGSLIVGYDPDFAPFAFESLPTRHPDGMAVDLGQIVADGLGVEVEYVAMDTSQLLQALANERPDPETGLRAGELDLAFPIVPLTEANVRAFGFSNPYFIAHQRLLVRLGSGITDVDDLSDKQVCAALDPTTGINLRSFDPTIDVDNGSAQWCFDALRRGDVAAVTAHDAILLAEVQRTKVVAAGTPVGRPTYEVEIVGQGLSTVGYGAAGPPASATFMTFVSAQLGLAKDDGRYMAIYDRWIRPLLGADADDEPPAIGVTEAAALYPQ